MDFFRKLNEKLDDGWKLCTSNCEECKKSLIYSKEKNILLCLGCSKTFEIDQEEQEEGEEQERKEAEQKALAEKERKVQDQINLEIFEKERQEVERQLQQKPDHSKAMSSKLIQGWTMLEECCPDCFIPIMRKGKESICVSCNNAYQRQKPQQTQQPQWPPSKPELQPIMEEKEQQDIPKKEVKRPEQETVKRQEQETRQQVPSSPSSSKIPADSKQKVFAVLHSYLDKMQERPDVRDLGDLEKIVNLMQSLE